jgi:hypothetical protein
MYCFFRQAARIVVKKGEIFGPLKENPLRIYAESATSILMISECIDAMREWSSAFCALRTCSISSLILTTASFWELP